ncbi:MAG TPA: family 16 glycosylhydrolase [Arachidicoccus sp.]|nr:family 16 glycosylhydrolase [Arachidicoccus sp.]
MQPVKPSKRKRKGGIFAPFLLSIFILNCGALAAQSNIVVAHRGAWKTNTLPQNSIASLQQAIKLGCMGSEFDVQLTADDSLVVNHDPVYSGDTIEQVTYGQLMKHPLANGESLPTLRQYLLAGLGQQQTKLVLEIKPSVISPARAIKTTNKVLELVKRFKATEKIIFISFDYNVLLAIHKEYPKAAVQYLNGDKSPETLKKDGISGADYHYSVFQKHPDWIQSAKKLGIILNAWTVNDTATIDWLLANNFDVITTNEPELVFERSKRYQQLYGQRELIFSDEFNTPGLPDEKYWTYDTGSSGWGNHELQDYTKADTANAHIRNGRLYIRALKDPSAPKGYSSARLVMKKGYKYGRIEIRAKLPGGRGLWPALWLLPDNNKYGGWPKSGEIDLMENVGYMPDSVFFTVHTEKYNHVIHTQKSKSVYCPTLYSQFHTYALEWTPEIMGFFMDDALQYSFKNEHKGSAGWPFDQPFHLLMNIAVGGDWGGHNGIDSSIFPQTMEVDYVRIFQEKKH